MLAAPDKSCWTEPPRGGGRVRLLGNVRFRRVFWEAQAGKRWWRGSRAVRAGAASAVKTGVKMAGAPPDGADALEAGRQDVLQ